MLTDPMHPVDGLMVVAQRHQILDHRDIARGREG
jgi:hypothetical protein